MRRTDGDAGRDADALEQSFARPGSRIATHPHASSNLAATRSEEHTSELQSLMRISYAVFCLKKKKKNKNNKKHNHTYDSTNNNNDNIENTIRKTTNHQRHTQ